MLSTALSLSLLLSLSTGALLSLSGCTGFDTPPPNPFEDRKIFLETKGPGRGEEGVSSALGRGAGENFCAGTRFSADGRRMRFSLTGRGEGGEGDAPDRVLALARRAALDRALRCSGNRQIVRSFFDNLYRIGGREGQVIEQDLIETMAAFSRYEEKVPSCQVRRARLSCRVLLVGEMRIEKADPGFGVTDLELSGGGVLPAGSDLNVRLTISVPSGKPVWLYLFDVDSEGRGSLLYPVPQETSLASGELPAGRVPGNVALVLPPVGSHERFRVALPQGQTRTVERLFVIVLRKGPLKVREREHLQKNHAVFYEVPRFSKDVLGQLFALPGAGSLWTFREVPFEIESDKPEGATAPSAFNTPLPSRGRP